VDGILIIDKPAGMTSHDVVARVRRVLGTKRVGHTGTLDPFATGVMVMLVGKATRLAQFIHKDEKEYEALIQFGVETDSGDRTGLRIADCGLQNEELTAKMQLVNWDDIFAKFRGEILQTPPMFSAKKIEGKKLYELARQGIEVERKPVKVVIHKLELLSSENLDPRSSIRMRVVCSAGTYIRTLAEDIGRELGVGAHLLELRRTAAGQFGLSGSVSLGDLESSTMRELLPIDLAVSNIAEFRLTPDRIEKTKSGLSTRADGDLFAPDQHVRMTSTDGDLVAIGIYDAREKAIRPKVVLI